jgi:gliding motility-associated-like protein
MKYLLLVFICYFVSCFYLSATEGNPFKIYFGDEPCAATALANNMLTFIEVDIDGGPSGVDDPGCGEFNGNDNWFSIVVPASGVLAIELEAGTITNAAFALYYGPCSNPSLINCVPSYLCGEDPMPKYFYEDMTPGAVVYLRIWDEDGGSGTVMIRVSNPYGNPYMMTGNAQPVSFEGSSNCIQLTTEGPNQIGCAWYPEAQDFNDPFDYSYSLYFGTRDQNGADGMCIIFQSNGIPTCGGAGEGIGAQGIPNSVIVEFDTWQNFNLGDPADDHAGMNLNGVMNHGLHPPVPLPNIEDGSFHDARVTWDPAAMIMTVFFDGVLVMSIVYDIINDVFDGNNIAWWGVSASTGGAWNDHILCFENIELENLNPVYTVVNPVICNGSQYFAGGAWQTQTGEYLDYLVAGNGCDSIVTTNLEVLPEVEETTLDTLMCPGEILFYEGVSYNQAGYHEITLKNDHNCDSIVHLYIEFVELIAQIDPVNILNCLDTVVTIQAHANGDPAFMHFFWYTTEGNIISDPNLALIEVDAPGFYYVEVSFDNGVVACGPIVLSINVQADQESPTIIFDTEGELGCDESTVLIDASQSIGGTLFDWYATVGGDIINGLGTPIIEVNGPGIYTLILTNEQNFCSWEESIQIIRGPVAPIINIATPPFLTCVDSFVIIDASGSEQQSFFTYSWTTSNGLILEVVNDLIIKAGAPGVYTLMITNTENGCVSEAQVEVLTYYDTIAIQQLPIDTLLCKRTRIDLKITIDPDTIPFNAIWTTTNGNIVEIKDRNLVATVDKSGLYRVEIVNQENGCKSSAEMEVFDNLVAPTAHAGPDITVTCRDSEKNLDGSLSSQGVQYRYRWSTQNGLIISGRDTLNPLIGSNGIYTIEVTDTINGCKSTSIVTVFSDDVFPEIEIAIPPILNCYQPEFAIDASNSNSGTPYIITWSSPDGNILSGQNTLQPLIDRPGKYIISIINEDNGCVTRDSVDILDDFTIPNADAGDTSLFTCTTQSLFLDGSLSSAGTQYTYLWQTADGNIISKPDSVHVEINSPGLYRLVVTDLTNGCSSVDEVLIEADENLPVIQTLVPNMLNCNHATVTVNAGGSSDGANFNYVWSTFDGSFQLLSKQVIQITEPGIYTLEITNTDNNCVSTRNIEITLDTIHPDVQISMPLILNCRDSFISPAIQILSQNQNLNAQWVTSNGSIFSGANTLSPVFNQSGFYELTLIDPDNGCTSIFNAVVTEDRVIPTVVLPFPDTITCRDPIHTISSTGSDTGSEFQYVWSTTNGNILSDPGLTNIQINQAGQYRLHIVNQINFCENQAFVTVYENKVFPVVIIRNPDTLTCKNPEIALNAAMSSNGLDFTVMWSTANGNITSGMNSHIAVVDKAGIYTIQITDQRNGCLTEQIVKVPVDTIAPMADAGSDSKLTCSISQVSLSGSGSSDHGLVQYFWQTTTGNILNGASTSRPLVNRHGWYHLVVTDPYNGCIGIDSAFVFPNEDTIQALNLEVVQPDCFNNFGKINFLNVMGGEPPFLYSIDGGSTFSSQFVFAQLPPGRYELAISDVNGCLFNMDTLLRGVVPVRIDLPPYFILPLGESIRLVPEINLPINQIASWLWQPADYLDCANCMDPISSPLQEISYQVIVTDKNGCIDIAETLIRVVRKGGVFIPSAFTPGNKDNINDRFTIYGNADMISKVDFMEIFDRWGNKIFTNKDFPVNEEEYGWDGSFRSQEMVPAVFVYVAKVSFVNGTSETFFGEFTLIR